MKTVARYRGVYLEQGLICSCEGVHTDMMRSAGDTIPQSRREKRVTPP